MPYLQWCRYAWPDETVLAKPHHGTHQLILLWRVAELVNIMSIDIQECGAAAVSVSIIVVTNSVVLTFN